MSLTITIRPAGVTSGGETKTLPAAGDNGNQEIDTKSEAENALAFLPDGSTNVVVVGDRSYTRAQLIEIRDQQTVNVPAASAPAASVGDTMIPGTGVSHGVALEGHGVAGLGDNGHGGGGARLTYRTGIPLLTGDHSLHLDTIIGADVGHFSRSYKTPGGEDVQSAFTGGSAVAGADLRWTPPWLAQRLWVGLGLRALVGGFGTADSTTTSLPAAGCTPGDFGRVECEPTAGPRSANTGATGLYSPRVGSARGTSGIMAGLEIPLTIGARVARGEWGSVDVFAGPMFSLKFLSPKNGDGFTSSGFGGFLGVIGRFGGTDSVKPRPVEAPIPPPPPPPDKDGDGVPDSEDKCPELKGTKENFGCPPLSVSVTSTPPAVKAQDKFLVGVKVGATSEVSVSFKDAAGTLTNSNSVIVKKGNSSSEFNVPADLKSGKYKLVVTFEDAKTGASKVEEKDVVIVENVDATLPGSFAPGQPPTIQNAKVKGMEKLEGVTYVIEGFDKDKVSVGTLDSNTIPKGDRTWTLGEKLGIRIPLGSPGGKGFKRDINYVVTLKNKEGHAIWSGSFEVGVAATYTRKVKPK